MCSHDSNKVTVTRSLTRPNSAPLAVFLLLLAATFAYLNFQLFVHYEFATAFSGDSKTYLTFSASRTIAYPAFVQLLAALPGFPLSVAVVQLNLLLGAAALFCWSAAAMQQNLWLASALFALISVHTGFVTQSLTLLTESLFVTVLLLHCVCVLRFLQAIGSNATKAQLGWLVSASLTAGVAILVRPAGYFIVACLAYLLLSQRHAFSWRHLASLTAPLAMLLLGASTVNLLRYDTFATQAIGGYSLVGHVAWAIKADPTSRYPELSADIESQLAPIYARRPETLAYPLGYQRYTSQEYNGPLWEVIIPTITTSVGSSLEDPDLIAINQVATTLAAEAISRDPGGYVTHAIAHFAGLWQVLLARPEALQTVLTRIAATSARRLEGSGVPAAGFETRTEITALPVAAGWLNLGGQVWRLLTFSSRVVATLLFALAVTWALQALFRRDVASGWLGYLAVVILASFGLVAAVQVALPRYAQVVMPMGLTLLFLSLARVPQLTRWLRQVGQAGHAGQGDRAGRAGQGDRVGQAGQGDRAGQAGQGDRAGRAGQGDKKAQPR